MPPRREMVTSTVVSKAAQSKTVRHAAASAPEAAYVGTSGWAYATWKPAFYPAGLPQRQFLEHYATRLNSVEVNYTFRQNPSVSTLQNWLAAAGDGFRFSFKAPQRISHIQRLKGSGEAWAAFTGALQPVVDSGRMGIVLVQLPPNFKADAARLDGFLAEAAGFGLRLAFEFRHASWLSDEVYVILRNHGAALCVAESDDFDTPDMVTAPFACYRLRRSGYTAAELASIAARLSARASEGEVYAYFKHEDEPTGALAAVEVLGQVRSA